MLKQSTGSELEYMRVLTQMIASYECLKLTRKMTPSVDKV